MKFITSLVLALVLFVTAAPPAFAKKSQSDVCIPHVVLVNPTDTQTFDAINLVDNTFTNNATSSTAHLSEDWFIVPTALKFWGLRVEIDTAPGTTGGTDTRAINLSWDPPGATGLTHSAASASDASFGCTLSGAETTCVDVSRSGTIVPVGSPTTIRMNANGSPSAPDAASELRISFCMSPVN